MHTNFIVNDYALMWNLLFQASISESIYKLKQKIWETYKEEYNTSFCDKNAILKDYKNYIPNDDTIYNILLELKDYGKIKKQAEEYRLEIMKVWDKNKKYEDDLIGKILRLKIEDYTFFIINKEFNIIDNSCENCLIIGRELDKKEPLSILIDINMAIVKNHIKRCKDSDIDIKKSILELAIYNEYPTRITGRSYYQYGSPSVACTKRALYPYWLMYLGVKKEDFNDYMMRDKIVFDPEKYAYEKELKKMNIEEFIEFCIRNKKYMIKN